LQTRQADPRHRVVGTQRRQYRVLFHRRFGITTRIGERSPERDDIRIFAVDLVTALEARFCFLEVTTLNCCKRSFEISE